MSPLAPGRSPCKRRSRCTVNTKNQITNTGFTYDAAGNLTNDGSQAYVYDAENQQTSASSTTYTFDGDGVRVSKSTGELDWFDEWGNLLAETDSSGGGHISGDYSYVSSIARVEDCGTSPAPY